MVASASHAHDVRGKKKLSINRRAMETRERASGKKKTSGRSLRSPEDDAKLFCQFKRYPRVNWGGLWRISIRE